MSEHCEHHAAVLRRIERREHQPWVDVADIAAEFARQCAACIAAKETNGWMTGHAAASYARSADTESSLRDG